LPFIDTFVEELATSLKKLNTGRGLSFAQRCWLKFCLMGVLMTNSVCWAGFERIGLGGYRLGALSWMFRKTKIPWEKLFQASVGHVLEQHGIRDGVLVADDSDHRRAKLTKRIFGAHKIFDKKTGGYFNGQTVVLLVLVSGRVTIPVGFRFYRPDPVVVAWRKEDKRLKKAKACKAERPACPGRNPAYPSKEEGVLSMIGEFRRYHPEVKVKAVLADALYGNQPFMDKASSLCGNVQVVSQLRGNQKIRFRNRELSLPAFFQRYPGVPQTIRRRGGARVEVIVSSARVHVCAHGKKRFVIALQYTGETECRYLVATDLSWRTLDIVQAHTLRWLVEVFLEDWKLYEGWGDLAKQPDEEGSSRGLALSLLCDHALILHPEQMARLEDKQPACTVGSLRDHCKSEAFLDCIRQTLAADNPSEQFEQLTKAVKNLFPLAPSSKHMSGRDLGRLEPTPSLQYRAATA
jgi:hypothetical protein